MIDQKIETMGTDESRNYMNSMTGSTFDILI